MRLLRLEGLTECLIERRVNRFEVQVSIGGDLRSAHLTNTGRLSDYIIRGKKGLCIGIGGPKLNYRLISVEDLGGYAILDTITQSKVFEHLLKFKLLPWLSSCELYRRNFGFGGEVFDYVLKCRDEFHVVELKSSVLRIEGRYASYPDCPTLRGRRQIRVLSQHADKFKPYVVFMASLPNVEGFKPNCVGDLKILEVMKTAVINGVSFKAINLYLNDSWVVMANNDLPVKIEC